VSILQLAVKKESAAREQEQALIATERRVSQRTRIGLVAASVLALLAGAAAIFGFHQEGVARQQGIVAEQRKQAAEQETVKAERERLKAEQETLRAEQETLKAEQRSGLLAADASRTLTEEGLLDQAILLASDAARSFNDTTAPDQIRIALSRALKKKERIESRTLFPDMKVFETDDALLLYDPATNDLWKLSDSLDPQRLVIGSVGDPGILKLRASPDRTAYIVVRDNFDVEKIDVSNGQRDRVGSLSREHNFQGKSFKVGVPEISQDGLVFMEFFKPDGVKETKDYFQVIDTETRRLLEGEKSDKCYMIHVMAKDRAGFLNAITYSGDPLLFNIFAEDKKISIRQSEVADDVFVAAYFGQCAASQSNGFRGIMKKELNKYLLINGTFACKQFSNGYLLTAIQSTSAGWRREDEILTSKGKSFDIRALLSDATSASLPRNNLSWVGLYRETVRDPSLKGAWLGVLLNKDLYIMEHDESSGDGYWPLVYTYRHPQPIEYARFVARDTLVVVEPKSGRLVAHYFGNEPKRQILTSNRKDILGHKTDEKPIDTPFWSWCLDNGWIAAPTGGKIAGKSSWLNGENAGRGEQNCNIWK
jgi:cell division protein FtsB